MSSNHSAPEEQTHKRHRVEGPRKHIIAFIMSLALTIIAFAAVAAGELDTTFTYILIVSMAILQVIIQMGFWMHMKDRGHFWPIVGIIAGVIVVLLMVVLALFWVWW